VTRPSCAGSASGMTSSSTICSAWARTTRSAWRRSPASTGGWPDRCPHPDERLLRDS